MEPKLYHRIKYEQLKIWRNYFLNFSGTFSMFSSNLHSNVEIILKKDFIGNEGLTVSISEITSSSS